ncbi:DnaJ domain-containing protein [Solidesulfovibrio sp.]
MDLPDYYAALGVAEDADADALRQAYRRRARDCHPDANPDDATAVEGFLRIARAYAVLGDAARRADYDRARRYVRAVDRAGAVLPATPPGSVASLVRAAAARQGLGGRRTLDIPHTLARSGGRLALDLGQGGPCPDCGGSGSLPRPCWMCDGRGGIWQPDGPATVAAPCPACHGQGLFRVPCPVCRGSGRHGRRLQASLVIPPGTPDGTELCIPGAGDPGPAGGPPGDLLLTLRLFTAPDADRH